MSSFKKSEKAFQRPHRERGQPSARKHLGLLEKRKDYLLRARDYHKKQASLKVLHEKARNRNPDEFYYKMVNTKLQDGRHLVPQPEESYSTGQLKLMKTQDAKYVQMRLSIEEKKVLQMQSNLHLLDQSSSLNKHTVFVDTEEEANAFDPTEHFETTGEFLEQSYNRPTEASLSTDTGAADVGVKTTRELAVERHKRYKELEARIRRSRELRQVLSRMQVKKNLVTKQRVFKIPGDKRTPATYRWFQERKK